MGIETEIYSEFEKYRNDVCDVYMEGDHPFKDYIKIVINNHGNKALDILDELLFENTDSVGAQIIAFMYYILPNHKDMNINIYNYSLKTFDKIAEEEIDNLGEIMSDFFAGYKLYDRLERMLVMNEHMQHMALPHLLRNHLYKTFSLNSEERLVLNSIVGTFYRLKNNPCADTFRKETIEESVAVFGIDKTVEILLSMSGYHTCISYLKPQIRDQLLHKDVKEAYEKVIANG